jgi:hypothetical protein
VRVGDRENTCVEVDVCRGYTCVVGKYVCMLLNTQNIRPSEGRLHLTIFPKVVEQCRTPPDFFPRRYHSIRLRRS